ncbi:transposase family protein [Nonomuraea sp. K274]|uniref:Transposase family protein n=1 Tax=Nonomuraea cypriaca TaxID=1187855 RepID=A0A931AI07_9ACTN|nr:transposase family protein [Nonomuraea cypriaca]
MGDDAPSIRGGGGGLLARFRAIYDKRAIYNTLHSLESILAVAACGTARVGGDTVTAISHWADDASQEILAGLGCRRDPFTGLHYPPSERTMRRVLAQTDGDEVDRHTSAYLAGCDDVRDLRASAQAGSGQGMDAEEPIRAEAGFAGGREREARRRCQRERERPRPAGMLQAGAADGKTVRGVRGSRAGRRPAVAVAVASHPGRGAGAAANRRQDQ